ncbi:MAG: hypothetical protein ACT4QG_12495 [Sporichthyaceae bacterium]
MAGFARIATRIAATTVALAAGIALAPAAPAAPAASAGQDRADLSLTGLTDDALTGSLLLDGATARLSDLTAVTQVVDDLGRAIGSPRTVALAPNRVAARLGNYSCLPKGKGDADFHQYPAVQVFRDDDKGRMQGLFHTYRQDKARHVRGQLARSTQYEICGVGGAAPEDTRIRRGGIGIHFAEAHRDHKIGQAWKTGSTPANYTLDMAFKAAHKGVEIGGGISQTPTNKLLGSISTPFDTPVDAYARNGVNAWWQDSCIGDWKGCQRWNGSKDFHGAVAHGLYEFTPAQADLAATGFKFTVYRSAS